MVVEKRQSKRWCKVVAYPEQPEVDKETVSSLGLDKAQWLEKT